MRRQGKASYWKRDAVDVKRKLDDLNNLHSGLRVRTWLDSMSDV